MRGKGLSGGGPKVTATVSGPSPTQTRFQVAVALIPALLFGGALAARREGDHASRRRGDATSTSTIRRRHEKVAAIGIVAVVVVATAAELIAINGTFDVNPSDFEIRVVVFALTLGTMAVGLSTCLSWAQQLFSRIPERHLIYTGGVILALVVALGAQFIITDAINGAVKVQTLNEVQASSDTASNAWQSANTALETARSTLAAALNDPSFRALPGAQRDMLTSTINKFTIDIEAAASSKRTDRFTATVNQETNRVFDRISAVRSDPILAQRLRDAVESFVNTEAEWQSALINLDRTSREFKRACHAAAPYSGCSITA
jgi:hypothetical protein